MVGDFNDKRSSKIFNVQVAVKAKFFYMFVELNSIVCLSQQK